MAHNATKERRRALAKTRTAPIFDVLAQRLGAAGPDALSTTITPHIDPPEIARSAHDIADFAQHLADLVRRVYSGAPLSIAETGEGEVPQDGPDLPDALPPELAATFARRDAALPEDPPALSAACIACGGDCCTTGLRLRAHLKPVDIAYTRHRNPDATPAAVLAAYLGHIPARSCRNACLYLTATGCALPRPMRSVTCNTWQCSARRHLGRELERHPDSAIAVVGLAEDHDTAPEAGAPMARVVTVKDGVVMVHTDLLLPEISDK